MNLFRRRTRPHVLITCSAPWTSPARHPWVLRRAGCRVTAFCPADAPLGSTRFVDRVISAPGTLDAYVTALEQHLEANRYDWVMLTDDMLVEALVKRAHVPALAPCFPVDPAGPWVGLLGSKAALVEAASELGVPIAPSATGRSREEVGAAAARLGYPVILKQSVSWAGLGVCVARDDAELGAAFDKLAGRDEEPLVVQRLVAGQVGNTIALYLDGVALCWASAFKARTYPGPFGPSCARQYLTHADVKPMLARFGERTKYRGFVAFDWVLDEATGRLAVIELNTRAVPAIHLSRFAGVDFARSIRDMLAGCAHVQRVPELPSHTPIVAMFPEDFYRASVEPTVTPAGVRELRYRDIPWTDWPLLAYHVRTTYRAWRALAATRTPTLPA
jgi:hypothetical protein